MGDQKSIVVSCVSYLIHKGQCLSVCLFVCSLKKSKRLDGLGWNLAWRWSSRGEGSWGCQPSTRWVKGVQSASGASTVHFGNNFIKQKLLWTPDLVGAGHLFGPQIWIWKDSGPMSFWSHGHSLWRSIHKIKVAWYGPNSYLVWFEAP